MDFIEWLTHPAMMLLWIYGIVVVWANLTVHGVI
jgi:hypothetical protein